MWRHGFRYDNGLGRHRGRILCIAAVLSCASLLESGCSIIVDNPLLEIEEPGLANSESYYGLFNFGTVVRNNGPGDAFEVTYELQVYGSSPGSYPTDYSVEGELYETNYIASNDAVVYGGTFLALTYVAKSYRLTVGCKNKSGEFQTPVVREGYFTLQ